MTNVSRAEQEQHDQLIASKRRDWDFLADLAAAQGFHPAEAEQFKREALEIQPRERMSDQGLHYQDYLYAMIRILKPLVVLEAGVRTGVSTKYTLEALVRNRRGHLVSFDPCYPSQAAAFAALEKYVDLSPAAAESRWTFIPKKIQELQLEGDFTTIDIFVHDSLHDEETYQWELDNVWPLIMPGGWMVADDYRWPHLIKQHFAFERHCAKLNLDWTLLGPQTAVVRKGLE